MAQHPRAAQRKVFTISRTLVESEGQVAALSNWKRTFSQTNPGMLIPVISLFLSVIFVAFSMFLLVFQ
jgi:hypothetical protein